MLARILIVEDEPLLSLMLVDWLLEMGHESVGPAATIAQALHLIGDVRLDAAILDVHLKRERSDEICYALDKKGIPFAFMTGSDVANDIPQFAHRVKVMKPYDYETMRQVIGKLCENTEGAEHI